MKIKQIFLDLDDVLNTLSPYLLHRLCGNIIGPTDYSKYPVESGWNIVDAHDALLRRSGCFLFCATRPKEFWDSITEEMWANVPKSPDCNWLVKKCETLVGWNNVFIATKPVFDSACYSGKQKWIDKNLPEYSNRFFTGTQKYMLSQKGRLLIDDNMENCEFWNRMGGESILYPRPWNYLSGVCVYNSINDSLNRIKNDN